MSNKDLLDKLKRALEMEERMGVMLIFLKNTIL